MGDLSDQEDLSARRIGDAAKQHVVSWAKWMLGAFALLGAIVGIRAYSDYQDTLKKLNDDFAKRVEAEVGKEVAKAVGNYTNFTAKIIEAIVVAEGRQRDLKKSLDEVQKQVATTEEEIRKFQVRLNQLTTQAEGEYEAYSAKLTLTVSKAGITGDQANPESQFRKSVENFARDIGLTFNVKLVFKQQRHPGVQALLNAETGEYEVNPAHIGSPDLAKHVAVMGPFLSKNYKRCMEATKGNFSYWDDFRYGVTYYLTGSDTQGPAYKLFKSLKALEAKAAKEQVRKLAVKLLEGYQCDWDAPNALDRISKINADQSIVPPALLQEAFASTK